MKNVRNRIFMLILAMLCVTFSGSVCPMNSHHGPKGSNLHTEIDVALIDITFKYINNLGELITEKDKLLSDQIKLLKSEIKTKTKINVDKEILNLIKKHSSKIDKIKKKITQETKDLNALLDKQK